MDCKFIPYLKELALKYSVAANLDAEFEEGAIKITCNKGTYRFFYDFSGTVKQDECKNVPLFHWQLKRRYVELRNTLDNGLVKTPLGMRIHHIVPRDEFTTQLKDIITYEANLIEFTTHQKISRVFADFYGDTYVNCIMSTDGNMKASLELGFIPDNSEPVLLHEIVCKNGIASDVVVDTQVQQYPIYVFKGKETLIYKDIDNELYDIDNTQVDSIRFILWALSDTSRIDALCDNYMHTEKICVAAQKANETKLYTDVEG